MIFLTKSAQKGYFQRKTGQVNKVPNFTLNWQLWYFGQDLPKKGIWGWKRKNRTCACVHSRYLRGADRHNSTLMSFLLLVAEIKIRTILVRCCLNKLYGCYASLQTFLNFLIMKTQQIKNKIIHKIFSTTISKSSFWKFPKILDSTWIDQLMVG